MQRTSSSSSSGSDRPSPIYRRRRSSSAPNSAKSSCKRKTARDSARLVVVGDQGVGKSALTVRLLTQRFIGTYQNEKDMVYKSSQVIKVEDENKNTRLEILDTTGANLTDEEGSSAAMDRLYWSTATVIVYDITNRQSFRHASEILKDIKREKPCHACLLLGNKTDLEHHREVKISDVTNLISSYANCLHSEVSAAASDFIHLSNEFQQLFALSRSVTSKSGVKRRRSIVDMAKAFGTLLRSTKNSENRTST